MNNNHSGPATAATIEIRTSSNWRLKEQGTSYSASGAATAPDVTEALVTSETALHPVPEVSVSITPIVELVEELTPEEESDRHRLELRVERAFRVAGSALQQLRDRRLYRSTHKNWDAYCRDRFGYGRDSADLKIAAAVIAEDLEQKLPTIRRQFLPTTLEQVRPLMKLPTTEKRVQAWCRSVDRYGGIPPGRAVKSTVAEMEEETADHPPIPYQPEQVFLIAAKSGALRKYNGCWAIATAVNNFTVEVEVHNAVLTVKPDNLDPIDSPTECQQIRAIAKRIKQLREYNLDRGAYPVLESLGRHTYLTPFEEGLLSFVEKWYLKSFEF